MLPELGLFCLILSLGLASLQILIYFSQLRSVPIMRPLAIGQTFFVMVAFFILLYAFITDDFTVQFVALNSNSSLPFYYKLTAVWGGHEGSLLLWILILNIWTLLVAIAARTWQQSFSNAVLWVFAVVNFGFLNILLWISNPFTRILQNVPLDGMDLNPMLQDIGMIVHPPILYIGYVGSTLAFAFAVAALLNQKVDRNWACLVQPWVRASWLFLTLGIALGSWWAYYELGWGGWWFWDPVENASFMPWLTATALLHTLAVGKKSGKFLGLAMFLAIITFALSLLGTFLVRSGVIVSVHAFVADPKRGFVILQFLLLLIGAALFLFMLRLPKLNLIKHSLHKSDLLILANNILLMVATGTVLLGTMYPLIYDVITGNSISVGYPYFNAVFIPLMLITFAVMLPGLLGLKVAIITLLLSASLSAGFLYIWFGLINLYACIGLCFALMIIASCFKSTNIAMIFGHLGLAVTIIGISITPNYEIERDVRMQLGDELSIASYSVQLHGLEQTSGANYVGWRAAFKISDAGKFLTTLFPEKRVYLAREISMSETAIMPGILQDVYIALGQQISANVWATRIYYKPFVRWIWFGAIIMAVGAVAGIFRLKFALKRVDLVERLNI